MALSIPSGRLSHRLVHHGLGSYRLNQHRRCRIPVKFQREPQCNVFRTASFGVADPCHVSPRQRADVASTGDVGLTCCIGRRGASQQASRPDTRWARRALTDCYCNAFRGPPCPIARAGQTQDVGRPLESVRLGTQRQVADSEPVLTLARALVGALPKSTTSASASTLCRLQPGATLPTTHGPRTSFGNLVIRRRGSICVTHPVHARGADADRVDQVRGAR